MNCQFLLSRVPHQQTELLTLPDVQADVQLRSVQPDAQRHVKHVGDNVVKSQGHECKDGPPHSDHLRAQILCLSPEEDGQTHEPVAAYASQEDLVHLRLQLLLGGEGDHLFLVWGSIKHTTICAAQSVSIPPRERDWRNLTSHDDGHDKQRACEVPKEAEEPVEQHLSDREPAVENRCHCKLGNPG